MIPAVTLSLAVAITLAARAHGVATWGIAVHFGLIGTMAAVFLLRVVA